VQEITIAFFWLKNKKFTKERVTRDELPEIWNEFLPRVEKYQHAHNVTEFKPRSGWACGYCPVTTCPHYKE
jgi:hypothetical protein